MNNIVYDFWTSFCETFNNREIAIIFWLLFIFFLALFKQGMSFLNSTLDLITTLFSKTILITQFTFWAYLIGVIFCLKILDLWNLSMLKDTFIFLSITAFMLVMKIATNKNREKSLVEILKDAVKPVILAEFIMNLESFSLVSEIFLIPTLLILYVGAYQNKDKPGKENAVKGFNFLQTVSGILILIYGIYYLFNHWSHWSIIEKKQTIRSFLFPVLTTLAFLPYLYLISQFFKWEERRVKRKIKHMNK